MNILAIGNSFSQDATRYLHKIAKADGNEQTANSDIAAAKKVINEILNK